MTQSVPGVEKLAGSQAPPRPAASPAERRRGRSFADVLSERARAPSPVEFSGHALDRLRRRGIALDAQTLARLEAGCARVAQKGGREALVLVDDTAFLVSVTNRTVITAVDRPHMKEQVFTNIDSAAIA